MAEYDLTRSMSIYFDRHLIFPLLEFICGKRIYKTEDILKCMLESLEHTKMADYANDVYKRLYKTEEVPESYNIKRDSTVEELRSVQASVKSILEIFSDNVLEKLTEESHSLNATEFIKKLSSKYQFDISMLDQLFSYAKVVFDCGNYIHAADALKIVQTLGTDNEKRLLRASWGKLACMILSQNWKEASEDLVKLKDLLDNSTQSDQLSLLQNRTWLLHWSLFVFFNHPKGKDNLIEVFFQPTMLNAIQTLAPHLLRYLSVCVVINCKKRKKELKDLVKVIQQESYNYKDPITEFVESLYLNFDFEKAQEKLKICEQVLANDFFLTACDSDFMHSARYLIFETFCKLHHTISMDMLATKLNMNVVEAEEWIVDLMQNAKLDAKIDSEQQIIIMGNQTISPYQQVFEKTKNQSQKASMHLAILKKKFGIHSDMF